MNDSFNLEWLRTFVVFYESTDIFETARKLRLTQPAVTQHLQKLQGCFIHPLFIRTGKRKVLTPFGEQLYQSIVTELHGLERTVHQLISHQHGPQKSILRLGLQKDILFRIGHKLVYPGQLQIQTGTSPELITKLKQNELDLVSSVILPDSLDLMAVKWFVDDFLFVFSKKWKKQYTTTSIAQCLTQEDFILHTRAMMTWEKLCQFYQISLSQISIKIHFDEWSTLLHYLQHHPVGALIPSSFPLPLGTYSVLSPCPLPQTQFYLIYHKHSRALTGFSSLLQQIKKMPLL